MFNFLKTNPRSLSSDMDAVDNYEVIRRKFIVTLFCVKKMCLRLKENSK
jgi:hypothetical protein